VQKTGPYKFQYANAKAVNKKVLSGLAIVHKLRVIVVWQINKNERAFSLK
jgi:hypothetical protein